MAYSSITKPEDHFNTKLYTGNGGTQSITGVGFQPDWCWIKNRNDTGGGGYGHRLIDAVRGATKELYSNNNGAENTVSTGLTSFDSDGFTLGSSSGVNNNASGADSYVAWNWLAGGTTPAITYSVKVVSDSGNKYRFDDYGTSAVTLDLQEGGTYTFDQSDSSNSGHPLRFSTTSDGTHGGGSEYTTNVTTTGTPGSAGAKTVITVAASAPTLYYYCTQHSGMGGQANTNSLFGSSNFSGSIQSTVSANTTAGFSIVSYTGTGSTATIGHGLGSAPLITLIKQRSSGGTGSGAWNFITYQIDGSSDELNLNGTGAKADRSITAPTSSVFSVDTSDERNDSGQTYICYCFAEKKGYSKFGKYTGNANTNGPFVYTGFKPAFVMVKATDATKSWYMLDNKRSTSGSNVVDDQLLADTTDSEFDGSNIDMLSNGFKFRGSGSGENGSGTNYIYMSFAENPFVANDSGTAVPVTAR